MRSLRLMFAVGIFLILGGFRELRHHTKPTALLLLVLGLLAAALAIAYWVRLRRGRILLTTTHFIDLSAGEVAFEQPAYLYELWIFCGVPFARYHGSIALQTAVGGQEAVIQLPRRRLW